MKIKTPKNSSYKRIIIIAFLNFDLKIPYTNIKTKIYVKLKLVYTKYLQEGKIVYLEYLSYTRVYES